MVDEHRHSGSNLSLERALLRAAAAEAAPPDVQRRALAALGLLVVATQGSAAATAAVATTRSVAPGGTLLTPRGAKVAVVVGLAGLGMGGLALARVASRDADAPVVVVSNGSSAAPSGRDARRSRARLGKTSVSPAVTADAALASVLERGTAAARRNPSIRAEARLLDRAQLALSDGASEQALSILSEYARRFPKGELWQEAKVLRIRAVRAQGYGRPAK